MSFAAVIRSCTASLPSRTLSRRAATLSVPGRSLAGRRHYSDAPAAQDAPKEATEEEAKSEAPKLTEIEEKLKAKEAEVVDLTGRLRYLQADFINLQRNSAREKEQTRDFAITRFANDLLETVDVLALALKSVPPEAVASPPSSTEASESASNTSSESLLKPPEEYLRELHTGVELTQRQLLQTLFKYHVKPFNPTGDKFDPNRHEALYQAPVAGKEPGSVIDCQKIGYMIKDRVLRAAQVGVAQEKS